ncbi:MAG: N-acetylmuramoyl-L-alanine amidase [Verrucomicrobiota bacterium]|nr:N-acetylmuramoyl-L-alanine amidase [Verrucomicrobiota bacterium]
MKHLQLKKNSLNSLLKTKMKYKIQNLAKNSVLGLSTIAAASVAYGSADYSPAIWNPPCNANYYTSGYGHQFHVIHDMEGYYLSVISMFNSCGYTSASVHYLINGLKDDSSDAPEGEITQSISEANYAWHVACWNTHCTGTEHEGFVSNPAWYTEAQYQASAGVTRHIADKFGFAKDRNHIVGHNEWQNAAWTSWAGANLGIDTTCNTHTDPGQYWDWNHYMGLINGATTRYTKGPCAAQQDGRMQVFAIGTADGALYNKYQVVNNGSWSSFENLAGTGLQGGVASGANEDGRLQVFVLGGDSLIYTKWQNVNNGPWSGWDSSFGAVGAGMQAGFACQQQQDKRMHLFVVGKDGILYDKWQLAINSGWSGWDNMGGTGLQPKVTSHNQQDGRLSVFAVGGDGNLYHKYQTVNNGGWSNWENFGSQGGGFKPSLAAWHEQDSREGIFVVGNDGVLYHKFQVVNNGSWSAWENFGSTGGGIKGNIAVHNQQDGRQHIMVVGNDGVLYNKWQTVANGSWSGWDNHGNGGVALKNVMSLNNMEDGRLQVFLLGNDNVIYDKFQTVNNGGWSGWENFGGTYKDEVITLPPAADIIVDNPSATIVGTWSTGTSATDKYGADYRYKGKGTGAAYLQFTPNVVQAGNYNVYEWHSIGSNRTTGAPCVVTYNGGSATVNVNQQITGGSWVLLGKFNFALGTGGNVKITDGFSDTITGRVVVADAIKLVWAP